MAYLSRGKRAVKESFASSSQPKKSRSRGLTPHEDADFWILSGLDKECFEARHISKYKGFGVFAGKKICKGDFLMQYAGDLISKSEADARENKKYKKEKMSYLYFFKHEGKELCECIQSVFVSIFRLELQLLSIDNKWALGSISLEHAETMTIWEQRIDASRTFGRIGRLVNDSTFPNAKMKKIKLRNSSVPYLALFALKDIHPEEEIVYDYGVEDLPWRNQTVSESESEYDSDPFGLLETESDSRKPEDIWEPRTGRTRESDYVREPEKDGSKDPKNISETEDTDDTRELGGTREPDYVREPEKEGSKDPKNISETEDTRELRTGGLREPDYVREPEKEGCKDPKNISETEDTRELGTGGLREPDYVREPEKEGCKDPKNISETEDTRELGTGGLREPDYVREPEKEGCKDPKNISETEDTRELGTGGLREPDYVREPEKEGCKDPKNISETEDTRELGTGGLREPDYVREPEKEGSKDPKNICETEDIRQLGTEALTIEDSCDSCQSQVFPNFGSILKPLAEVRPMFRPKTQKKAESLNSEPDFSGEPALSSSELDNDDEEYKPLEEDGNSDSSDSEPEDNVVETPQNTDFGEKMDRSSKIDKYSLASKVEIKSASEVERGETQVLMSKNSENKRIWDKQHCCIFCMQLKSKLPRHLEQIHKDEIEVATFLALPKRSVARSKAIEELRRKGDFAYNIEAVKKSEGAIIPVRRPDVCSNAVASNFIPCEDCLGFFLSKDLWRHKKKCARKKFKEANTKSIRGTHQSASAALLPVTDEAKTVFRAKILDTMANDSISMVARTDSLIVQFGTKLFSKTGQEKHQHQYIRQKMRELSRFLLTLRQLRKGVWSLSDCINPVIFKFVIEAVKHECGYDPASGRYKIPSLALKLGHSLKKCCNYLKSTVLQVQNEELRRKTDDFKELLDSDWQSEISSQALSTLHANTFNKPMRIPLTDDIRKLNVFLQEQAGVYKEALKCEANEVSYQKLSQVTQAQIVLFNRRRGGEVERIPLLQYNQGIIKSPLQEDIAASLSPFERKLTDQLHRIEIRGKRGRKVPVLFTRQLKEQVDLLIQNRPKCGIYSDSPFLFSRVGDCKTPFRSSDALSKFARQCGAEKPNLLQSTNLRFHIGTVSQILNLKENELDILAGFMGHDIRIHRQFYRLPDDTLQLAKVSKILMEMEKGHIHRHRGKSLDEIKINENETVSDPEEEPDEDHHPQEDTECHDISPTTNNGKYGQKKTNIKKKSADKKLWSDEEKNAVARQLSKFILLRKVPGKHDCELAISQEAVLASRSWQQIKFCVKNINASKKALKELGFSV